MTTYNFTTTDASASIISTMNSASASDTFSFATGTYRGITWTPKANQIVKGATGAQAILSGGIVLDPADFVLYSTGGQTYHRIEITHTFYTADQTIGSYTIGSETGYERAWMNTALWVDNTAWRNMDELTDLDSVESAFYIDYAGSPQYLYIKNSPYELGSAVLEMNSTPYLCEFTVAGLTFQNIIIEKYASRIQRSPVYCSNTATGSGLVWQNVTSRYNNSVGVRVGDGAQITYSRLLHNAMAGYSGKGDDIAFIGCEIANNNWSHVNRGFEGGAGKLSGGTSTSCDNCVIRGCYVHDNYGKGIWFDIECGYVTKCLIEYNLITEHFDAGIFWETCFDVIIRGNTLVNNCNSGAHTNQPYDCQLMVVNSQVQNELFLQVYENVVVVANLALAGGGIGVTQSNRGNSTINTGIVLLTKKVRAYNNIVYHPNGTGRNGLAANYDATAFYNTYDNQFQGNTYFSLTTGDGLFQYNGSNLAFAGWQVVTSPDTFSKAQDTTASGATITADVSGAPAGTSWRVVTESTYQDTIRAITNLVSYFPMDETTGTVVYERSPYGVSRTADGAYAGTYTVNDTTFTDGEPAVRLTRSGNGRTGCYTSVFDTVFNRTKFTAGGWVKMSADGNWTDGLRHGMLRIGGSTGAGNFEAHIDKQTTNNRMQFFAQDGTGTSAQVNAEGISGTGWKFAVYAYDLADPLATAYLDGASVGTDTTITGTSGTSINSIYGHGRSSGLTGNNLDGWLSNWFVVNDQLTTAQVLALADATRPPIATVVTALPAATVGEAYSETLVTATVPASPAIAGVSFAPSWLDFDANVVSGTPTSGDVGTHYFLYGIVDGGTLLVPVSITVNEAAGSGGDGVISGRSRSRGRAR